MVSWADVAPDSEEGGCCSFAPVRSIYSRRDDVVLGGHVGRNVTLWALLFSRRPCRFLLLLRIKDQIALLFSSGTRMCGFCLVFLHLRSSHATTCYRNGGADFQYKTWVFEWLLKDFKKQLLKKLTKRFVWKEDLLGGLSGNYVRSPSKYILMQTS